ncbi:MAG: pancreas/duodenum homeobox protein 1 [Desulfobulbus propionicus]|nr:MAG: pancreas/duodenum homeobox protein 1 [Desulfobulbus propionicus]
MASLRDVFTDDMLTQLFPPERSNDFFEALFGDPEEGAYDIALTFVRFDAVDSTLHFLLELRERPGYCLACNLTYGLPEVFSRHPVINLAGLVKDIGAVLGEGWACEEWKLGATIQADRSVHTIPLVISVRQSS